MFSITIAFGANLFVLLVILVLSFAVGLSTTDFLKTKDREEKTKEIE